MNKFILTSAVFFVSVGLTQAQLKDIMLKKAGEKLNKKSESSPSNSSTNTNESKPDSTSGGKQENSSPMFSYGGKKEVRAAYNFTQNVLFDMKSFDKKGNPEEKKNMQMRMLLGNDPYTGTEIYDDKKAKLSFGIMDAEKEQSVTFMDNDGNKMAIVSKLNVDKVAEEQNKDNVKVTKTGRTKMICNYSCEEYLITDDKQNKTEVWVTNSTDIKANAAAKMFATQNKTMGNKIQNVKDYPQGFMLQMINYQTNGERFEMTAVEVNVSSPKTVETAGYTVY